LKSVFCRAQNFLSTLLTLALTGILPPEEGLRNIFDSLLAKSDFSYDEAMMTN
jgi:hypothetical protein